MRTLFFAIACMFFQGKGRSAFLGGLGNEQRMCSHVRTPEPLKALALLLSMSDNKAGWQVVARRGCSAVLNNPSSDRAAYRMPGACMEATTSTLVGTTWRMKLNFGLEPGSWMPKTIAGWGASGTRMIVNVDVCFDANATGEAEELVGPQAQTRALTVLKTSSIVTIRGEEQVDILSGGWCVQRGMGSTPDDMGELRFWLDCKSGCARGDVSVPPGERIFFCASVWDSKQGIQELLRERSEVKEKLRVLTSDQDTSASVPEDSSGLAGIPLIGKALNFRQKVLQQEKLVSLRQANEYFQGFPDLDDDLEWPAQIKKGSISLKRSKGLGPLASNSYHILGTFAAEPRFRET